MSLRAFLQRHSDELAKVARSRGLPADFFLEDSAPSAPSAAALEQCYADAAALLLADAEVCGQEQPRLLAALGAWVWGRAGLSVEQLGSWMHDLRNAQVPLGYVSMALQGNLGPTTEQQRRYLGVAARSARTLEDQLGLLQSYLHALRGGLSARAHEVQVRDLLERAGSFYDELSARAEVRWSVSAPCAGACSGDVELLVRALRALLDNALRACASGCEVRLGAELAEGAEVVFFVVDTGCGMSQTDLARWARPFERGFEGRGLGLGLPTARAIIEAHGSRLVVSSHPGRGTRASFALPLVD